jgi:ABC-type dipeptide/oligopeptide/nickel transport system permease subunit
MSSVPLVSATEEQAHATEQVQAVEGRSLTQIAWGRLRRDKVAMISLTVIILIFLAALFAPLITRLLGIDPYEPNTDLVSQDGGLPLGRWGGISWDHPLGVEPLIGRDILARLLFGARISLTIAASATFLVIVIGVVLGTVAGYSRGKIDTVLSRIMDLTLSFPFLLLIIAMAQPLQQRLETWIPSPNAARVVALVLLMSLFSWPYLARIVRGQVLSLREREFVEAAISTGASSRRILFKELIPNLWAPVLVYASLAFPGFISAEAALAYLGVGVLPPTPTWGAMLNDSVRFFTVLPTYLFIPGMALFITVLVFNLFGDAVRDALDPRAGRG